MTATAELPDRTAFQGSLGIDPRAIAEHFEETGPDTFQALAEEGFSDTLIHVDNDRDEQLELYLGKATVNGIKAAEEPGLVKITFSEAVSGERKKHLSDKDKAIVIGISATSAVVSVAAVVRYLNKGHKKH